MVTLWVSIYAAIILSFLFVSDTSLVLLLAYAALAAYMYYALRLSFPKKLPPEAVSALSSLAIATLGSIILHSLFAIKIGIPYEILYGSTILVWIAASWYARTRAPPEAPEVTTA